MYDRDKLIALFHSSKALRTGDFVLASGKKSNFFLDVKLVSLEANGLSLPLAVKSPKNTLGIAVMM